MPPETLELPEFQLAEHSGTDRSAHPHLNPVRRPPRPAWIEIDLKRLRRNYAIIAGDLSAKTRFAAVIKDEAYGHGALPAARAALKQGAAFLAVSTIEEALKLREARLGARILLLGDRHESEYEWCIVYDLTCCVSEPAAICRLAELAARRGKRVPVHIKVNTGMNRYGVRWSQALSLASLICQSPFLTLEGVLSHFAQSDEADKTFALLQLSRFEEALRQMACGGIAPRWRHICNSGGFLDLPQAHFDMVRVGLLPLGVYPSSVCRRIPGIEPVMTVKARVASLQHLSPGDTVGYGMRFTAATPRRIAVLPIGYGDGFPRVRNEGFALIHGRRAPLVGGVAMDALTVDVTEISETQLWDEAVLMGRQEQDEITAQEMARLKKSVSYDVLCGWRERLPRIYLGDECE